MKNCQKCGAEMVDNMNFCPKCHAKYEAPASAPTVSNAGAYDVDPVGNAANGGMSTASAGEVKLNFWQKMWQRRMTRRDFWLWQLIDFVVTLGAGLVPGVGQIISGVVGLYSFIIAWPRLHDAGKSAWNLLWYLLPIIGWIILIVLYCQPSEKGENKWGPEPQRMFGDN